MILYAMTQPNVESSSPSCLPGMVPSARQIIAPVVEQVRLARDTYRVRIESPELAREVVPGQFVMIRSPGLTNPLLGRPFALYDVWCDAAGNPAGIDVAYLVVGKMTGLMSTWTAGNRVEVWGPLGNGFPIPECDRLVLVAGGIGNTPFPAVAREALGCQTYGNRRVKVPLPADRVSFCYGARSAEYLAGLDIFRTLGIDVDIATDDGSHGHKGFVTDLVARQIETTAGAGCRIYCCGPEPMMHAVAKLAGQHNIPCWLSLETPMACGFGACFSCVTRVRQPDGDWDYRRTCVEGPIFPAEQLAF
jgi:dihydroorotate dehydrogenase electron transfer subunit